MKKWIAVFLVLLYSSLAFSSTVFAVEDESENVALVRSVFMAISGEGDSDAFGRIADTGENMDSRADSITLNFSMYIKNIELNEFISNYVQFSCEVPSPAYVALDMAGFADASNEEVELGSIKMEGIIPIIQLNNDDELLIDISGGDNPISLFFNLRLYAGDTSFIPQNLSYTSEDQVNAVVDKLNKIAFDEYNRALNYGMDTAVNEEELHFVQNYARILLLVSKSGIDINPLNKANKSRINWKEFFGSDVFKTALIVIGVIIALIVVFGLSLIIVSKIREFLRQKTNERIAKMNVSKLIQIYRDPPKTKKSQRLWGIYSTIRESEYAYAGYEEYTTAGWALAALGKMKTQGLTPNKFHNAINQYKKVARSFNGLVRSREKAQADKAATRERLKAYIDNNTNASAIRKQEKRSEQEIKRIEKRIEKITAKLNKGVLYYTLKANVAPFGYLLHVLNDNQFRYDRFMKQGVIMGLLDFFMKHKDHKHINPSFEQLIAIRAELISSTNHMSFFEVRTNSVVRSLKNSIVRLKEHEKELHSSKKSELLPNDTGNIEIEIDFGGQVKIKRRYSTELLTDELLFNEKRFVEDLFSTSLFSNSLDFKGTLSELWDREIEKTKQRIENLEGEIAATSSAGIDEYSYVLGEVLHCANPSLKYCDTKVLLNNAVEEIPNLMQLLGIYPLRLIDPGKKDEQGFYEFEPYKHSMWVQYEPPFGKGMVIRRFHEVLDMTIPNSTGLNVRLFTDEFAAIPTMFHEYCHYEDDHNEASVFLRTQLFSGSLYNKYRNANPMIDMVFSHLCDLLGEKPNAKNTDKLNDLIEKIYGKQVSPDDATVFIKQRIDEINQRISILSAHESWHPEIKMPFLNNELDGDSVNTNLIETVLMRYYTMPRRVTATEFDNIIMASNQLEGNLT